MTQQPNAYTTAGSQSSILGTTLSNRYRIIALLGEGGMGAVYEAEHLLMRNKVAVKVLHKDMSTNSEMAARFQREAQAAAAIDHPNICAATDFGKTANGELFMVMEYLEGRGLDQVLAPMRGIGAWRTVHIAQQICGVLEQAHSMKIVHRDLKPENIMLLEYQSDQDFVKVLDFGVARFRADGENTRLTRAGVVYGTPTYMSPEQVIGSDIDARADLYALGVMMYEMVTGRVPFEGKSIHEVMNQHLVDMPVPPNQAIKDKDHPPIPRALEALILRLLEKKAQDRLQSATQLREILLDFEAEPNTNKWTTPKALAPIKRVLPTLPIDATDDADTTPSKKSGNSVLLLLGLIMAFGLLVGVIIGGITVLSSTDEDRALSSAVELVSVRDEFIRDNDLGSALEAMARGKHKEALSVLQKSPHPKNPHYHYYVGVAHQGLDEPKLALSEYAQSVALDPAYAQDKQLVKDVISFAMSKDDDLNDAARDVLKQHIKAPAIDPLIAKLREASSRSTKRRAIQALEAVGGLEKLPEWERLSEQLSVARGCKPHRELLVKIAALADPRTRDAVRALDKKPRRGCGRFNVKDCYGCIRSDIKDTLEVLDQAPEVDPSSAAKKSDK